MLCSGSATCQLLISPLWGCHLPNGQDLCGPEVLQSASCSECCGKDPTLFCPALVGQDAATDEGSALGTEQWRRPKMSDNAGNVLLRPAEVTLPRTAVHGISTLHRNLTWLCPHSGFLAFTDNAMQQGSSCPCKVYCAGLSVKSCVT